MPTAIGKSYAAPSLGISAGARLTVIFFGGKSKPLLIIAVFTRSRASSTALLASPTMVNPGNPAVATSTSTSIGIVVSPILAVDRIFVNMLFLIVYTAAFDNKS